MNYQILSSPRRCTRIVAVATILGMLGSQHVLTAAEPGTNNFQQKNIVGRAALITGVLLHRDNNVWKPLAPQADIYADDLIVALPAGAINSKSKNVRLTLLSDLARVSPYPVFESAVQLHDSNFDLDFTLDRGRVDITNIGRTGEAKVKIRFEKQSIELTLGEKAKVAFELFGRWPAGSKFSTNPKPDEDGQLPAPTLDLVMIVKSGKVELKAFGKTYAMTAPKGKAYYHWDSVPPFNDEPKELDSLPTWAEKIVSIPPNAGELLNLIRLLVTKAREKPDSIEEGLTGLLTEDNAAGRRVAVYALGALDDLPPLIDAVSSSKFSDVRSTAVIALRHWIGRAAGQDLKLYDALLKKGYTDRNAHRFVQLLHSFSNQQKATPATYETLIELLGAENPAIRELANWHLVRLAPKGQDINFNPLGTAQEREEAVKKWKELIPAGKLPAKEKTTN